MLLHADNFSIYGGVVALLLNGVYSEASGCSLVTDPDVNATGKVLQCHDNGNNTNFNWRYPLQNGAQPIVGIAQRVWLPYLPADNSAGAQIAAFDDGANNILISVAPLSTGALRITALDASNNPTNFDTPVPVISAQGWYHIECKFNVTAGTVEVRVEGVSVITATITGHVRAGNTSQVAGHFVGISTPPPYYVKDLVIWDGSGSQNNDFFGSVLVASLVPNGDVSLNWSLNGGTTGYGILDNTPPNDAAYIYAPHSPAPAGPYVGALSDLPTNVTSVKGIVAFVRAAKADGGDGSLQTGVISGASTGLGSNRPITVAQTYWRDIFELDPATGAAWLPSAVNAAKLQINRTV